MVGIMKSDSFFLEDFIETCKENPYLWKAKSKAYSDKSKKQLAYEKFAEKLREQLTMKG
jgi:hypothetical protein